MAAAPIVAAVAFNDIMDNDPSFITILQNFGLTVRATSRFREDFPTARDLIPSTRKHVHEVIENQNKLLRFHTSAAQRCYINAVQMNRILTFQQWTKYAIRDAEALYDVANIAEFNENWIDSLAVVYLTEDPDPTDASTTFAVSIPKFIGTNWHEVKSQFHALLASRIGHCGLPLTYLVRDTRLSWLDTEHYTSLQKRRMDTIKFDGPGFDMDNREFYRIISRVFDKTTLEDLIRGHQRSQNGINAWHVVKQNVEGASYSSELKRKADSMTKNAFYDPSKNFSFETYFQIHTKAHELMASAGAPVPEWKKISDFMSGIRCSQLLNDYRQIKDLPTYTNSFAAFYNKINENYRMLIEQKIIKPISLNRRRISQVTSNRGGGHGGRGRGGRGGRGGRSGRGRFNSRFNRGGRGTGRGNGSGRGNHNSNSYSNSNSNDSGSINFSCLPNDINLNNLQFTDERWYNEFTQEQRDAINGLRSFRCQQHQNNRNVNSVQQQQVCFSTQDEVSALSNDTSQQQQRHVYQIQLQPPPEQVIPPTGNAPVAHSVTPSQSSASSQSSRAGSVFGRPPR